jgi:methylenetetrahydrofolate dehydrogenase (NADP+)/methenyltetrahydrofolate cyclohydrolase
VTADIIDGKAFAEGLRGRLGQSVPDFVAKVGRKPGLAVILVGEDPASAVYVRNKGISTREVGMESFEFKLPADVPQDELLALVAKLNADDAVDGILVQLPLPAALDEKAVIGAIDPDKDVDGLHVVNAGRLASGLPGLVSCTPLGCMMLLKDRLGNLSGMDAVVIGRSILVGKPVAQLLVA